MKKSIAVNVMRALVLAMLYLWQVAGIEQAGNIFLFFVWFVGIVGILAIFVPPSAQAYRHRGAADVWLGRLVGAVCLFGALWAGHIFAATVYAVGWLATQAYVEACRKLAMGEAQA